MKKCVFILAVISMLACVEDDISLSNVNQDQDLALSPPPPQNQNNRALVFRFDGLSIYGFPVPEKDITLLLGFSIREFCNGDFSSIDVFDLHRVIKDEGDDLPRIHEIARGNDVLLEIWPFADLSFGADCQPFFDHDPVFSGRVDVKIHDNDLIPFDSPNKNVNVFGFKATSDEIFVNYQGAWDGFDDNTWHTRACLIKYN